MADLQGATDIDSLVTRRRKTEADLAAVAILARWCRAGDTELMIERLAVLERVCQMIRAGLPGALGNSSQLLAHRLTAADQEWERRRELARQYRDARDTRTAERTQLELAREPTP